MPSIHYKHKLPALTYLQIMSITSPASATRSQPVGNPAEIAISTMLQILKDSNADPPSIANAQANPPIFKSLITDPTATYKESQENPSSMPATLHANFLLAQLPADGVINFQ